MRKIIFFLVVLFFTACEKENTIKGREVENLLGIVIETDDGFEIITDEEGILLPGSELPAELKKDGQFVTISGKLKAPVKTLSHNLSITPIDISSIELRTSAYDKTDITLAIIKSEDYGYKAGFGYFIENLRYAHRTRVLQPHLPAVSGLEPFCTQEDATKTGIALIYLLRKYNGGAISVEFLDHINVNSKCNQTTGL
jgi:hypothetical protein